MGWKTEIPGDNKNCPCGQARFKRWSICDEDKTDGFNIHYDICPHCNFQVHYSCNDEERLERYLFWLEDNSHPNRYLQSKRRCEYCVESYKNNTSIDNLRCRVKIGLVDRTCVEYERKWWKIFSPE